MTSLAFGDAERQTKPGATKASIRQPRAPARNNEALNLSEQEITESESSGREWI